MAILLHIVVVMADTVIVADSVVVFVEAVTDNISEIVLAAGKQISNLPTGVRLSYLALMKHKDLYHIKWLRNKIGYISTTDLTDYFPLILSLKPRIPYVDPIREDNTIPRVCFATTLAGAVGSLGLPNESQFYLGIYKPILPIEIHTNIRVHDAEKWGEVWSLRPVLAELKKIIYPGDLIY